MLTQKSQNLTEILAYYGLPGCWATSSVTYNSFQWPMWCVWFMFIFIFIFNPFLQLNNDGRVAFLIVEGMGSRTNNTPITDLLVDLCLSYYGGSYSHAFHGLQINLVPQDVESDVSISILSLYWLQVLNICSSGSCC